MKVVKYKHITNPDATASYWRWVGTHQIAYNHHIELVVTKDYYGGYRVSIYQAEIDPDGAEEDPVNEIYQARRGSAWGAVQAGLEWWEFFSHQYIPEGLDWEVPEYDWEVPEYDPNDPYGDDIPF